LRRNNPAAFFFLSLGLWFCLFPVAWADDNAPNPQLIEQGKRIYRDGVLSDGSQLRASQGSLSLSGAEAACVRCHRRSGFGGSEGRRFARPLVGKYLFSEPDHSSIASRVPHELQNRRVAAYTTPTLIRALSDGIDSTDRPLDPLMPRYKLSAQDVQALNAYFVSLSANLSPGVDDTTAHFATIVTDEVPPEKSAAMLDMLNIFVADKNAGTRIEDARKRVGRDYIDRAYRKWELHVWQLSGPADTWPAQLEDYYRNQPVFAVISGISTQSWAPIHAFCERMEMPCVYPNTVFPVASRSDVYPIYFSRGVALEAEALAKYLTEGSAKKTNAKIVQVFRKDSAGSMASQVLRKALAGKSGFQLQDMMLDTEQGAAIAESVKQAMAADKSVLLVNWLHGADVQASLQGEAVSKQVESIYLSASLVDNRWDWIPESVRSKTLVLYPYDIPTARDSRLARFRVWLKSKNIPLTDEAIQANSYFAASITADAFGQLTENFYRDYLIERIEHMSALALTPTVFPRLTLGPGQRFASKGAYVMRLTGPASLAPVSEWLVP
jgi:hypothetical protein